MPVEDIHAAVRGILSEVLTIPVAGIGDESLLRDDLEVDSLDLAEIDAALDDLGLRVDPDDLRQAVTVGDLFALVAGVVR